MWRPGTGPVQQVVAALLATQTGKESKKFERRVEACSRMGWKHTTGAARASPCTPLAGAEPQGGGYPLQESLSSAKCLLARFRKKIAYALTELDPSPTPQSQDLNFLVSVKFLISICKYIPAIVYAANNSSPSFSYTRNSSAVLGLYRDHAKIWICDMGIYEYILRYMTIYEHI